MPNVTRSSAPLARAYCHCCAQSELTVLEGMLQKQSHKGVWQSRFFRVSECCCV